MGILDSLNIKRQIVGVSLTPGIGLEAVILNKTKDKVEKYGKRDVLYNFSTREIQNMQQFKSDFSSLMGELGVSAKAEINLVLPNILFEFVDIPAEVPDEGIQEVILNKAEDFYLFKREEPVSGYCEVENFGGGTNRRFLYSSFQKNAVDQIKEIINELGYNLIGVETAYSAALRGLYLTHLIDSLCMEQEAWTLMLVNSNSYTLFQMEGKHIVNYNDVPLAIKSFSVEEAYQSIVQGASQLLSNYITSKLFIASQTDDISAEFLKKQIKFDRDIEIIESNKFSKSPIMEVLDPTAERKANAMTLTAIGAASGRVQFPITLNVLANDPTIKSSTYKINLTGQEQEVEGAVIDIISYFISGVIAIVGVIIVAAVSLYGNTLTTNLNGINSKITELDAEIASLDKVEEVHEEIDINSVIDEVAEQNIATISFYDSISTDIPKNVWLTKYYNKLGKEIVIRGIAENIVDVYEYYKNLRIVSPQSDIKLNELRVVTGDNQNEDENKFISGLNLNQDKDRLYSFEIANTSIQTPSTSDGGEAVDENNILRRPPAKTIDEPSQQMTPAQ